MGYFVVVCVCVCIYIYMRLLIAYHLSVYVIYLTDVMRTNARRRKKFFGVQLKKKTNQQFKMKGIIILSNLCFCSADLKLVFLSIFSA